MAHYKAILAYDGTDFFGFQRQARERTVQAEVERALVRIGWQGSSILAAGRTDTGVHASGQVIAFRLDWAHGCLDLRNAINANLAADAAIQVVKIVGDDFHPRFDARSRKYVYRIFGREARDPLRERYAWRLWPLPDVEALRQAAAALVGEHDFQAFGSPAKPAGKTVRTVFQANWYGQGDELRFEVRANAFLYHMVRRMVRAQVDLAVNGRPETIAAYLDGSRDFVPGLAPARGLTLAQVDYQEEN